MGNETEPKLKQHALKNLPCLEPRFQVLLVIFKYLADFFQINGVGIHAQESLQKA